MTRCVFLEKQFYLTVSHKFLSSHKLYSNVVRSGSSDEDLGFVHGEQNRKIDGHACKLVVITYQHESEEVALEESLKLSQVKFFNF